VRSITVAIVVFLKNAWACMVDMRLRCGVRCRSVPKWFRNCSECFACEIRPIVCAEIWETWRTEGASGVDPGGGGVLTRLKLCRRGQNMFRPPPLNMSTFFRSELLLGNCKFNVVENERLVSKMEGKTNFSGRLKQFDGLT